MPAPQRYYHRRSAEERPRQSAFELVVTIVVLAAVIGTILVFLFVFHDIPFRFGEP